MDPVTSDVTITFSTVPGRTYLVEYTDDLTVTPQTLTSVVAGMDQYSAFVTDPGAGLLPQRFYRVTETPGD
jgi:hypothetical protein